MRLGGRRRLALTLKCWVVEKAIVDGDICSAANSEPHMAESRRGRGVDVWPRRGVVFNLSPPKHIVCCVTSTRNARLCVAVGPDGRVPSAQAPLAGDWLVRCTLPGPEQGPASPAPGSVCSGCTRHAQGSQGTRQRRRGTRADGRCGPLAKRPTVAAVGRRARQAQSRVPMRRP